MTDPCKVIPATRQVIEKRLLDALASERASDVAVRLLFKIADELEAAIVRGSVKP